MPTITLSEVITFLFAALCAGFGGGYAVGYLRRKGENRAALEDSPLLKLLEKRAENAATKADIGELTRIAEETKAEINRGSFEHQQRFARLHERQAAAIAEVYDALVDAETALKVMTVPVVLAEGMGLRGTREHWVKDAEAKLARFVRFENKALYFDEHVLEMLRHISHAMLMVFNNWKQTQVAGDTASGEQMQQWIGTWTHARDKSIPDVKKTLEQAWRRELVGDRSGPTLSAPPLSALLPPKTAK